MVPIDSRLRYQAHELVQDVRRFIRARPLTAAPLDEHCEDAIGERPHPVGRDVTTRHR